MRFAVGRILGILTFTALLAGVAGAQEPIDLGTLPGYSIARARSVNDRGDAVGQAAGPLDGLVLPPEQAVLWRVGRRGVRVAEALPPLPDFDRSDARGFVGGHTPVGFSYRVGDVRYRAVLWRRDPSGARVPIELDPTPEFDGANAQAFAANARGQIVGQLWDPLQTEADGSIKRHAASWRLGRDGVEVCDLGVPEGFSTSAASDVNEAGAVVGTASRIENGALRSEVVVWWRPHRRSGGCEAHAIVLGGRDDLPAKQNPSIDASGDIVARADRTSAGQPTVSRALVWPRHRRWYGRPFELPLPAGFTDAYASDVNARGVVLGTALARSLPGSTLASRAQGVVWTFERGRVRIRLLANPNGVAVASAERMNHEGEVVGIAPVPLAGAGALLWQPSGCQRHGGLRGYEPSEDRDLEDREEDGLRDSRSYPRD